MEEATITNTEHTTITHRRVSSLEVGVAVLDPVLVTVGVLDPVVVAVGVFGVPVPEGVGVPVVVEVGVLGVPVPEGVGVLDGVGLEGWHCMLER